MPTSKREPAGEDLSFVQRFEGEAWKTIETILGIEGGMLQREVSRDVWTVLNAALRGQEIKVRGQADIVSARAALAHYSCSIGQEKVFHPDGRRLRFPKSVLKTLCDGFQFKASKRRANQKGAGEETEELDPVSARGLLKRVEKYFRSKESEIFSYFPRRGETLKKMPNLPGLPHLAGKRMYEVMFKINNSPPQVTSSCSLYGPPGTPLSASAPKKPNSKAEEAVRAFVDTQWWTYQLPPELIEALYIGEKNVLLQIHARRLEDIDLIDNDVAAIVGYPTAASLGGEITPEQCVFHLGRVTYTRRLSPFGALHRGLGDKPAIVLKNLLQDSPRARLDKESTLSMAVEDFKDQVNVVPALNTCMRVDFSGTAALVETDGQIGVFEYESSRIRMPGDHGIPFWGVRPLRPRDDNELDESCAHWGLFPVDFYPLADVGQAEKRQLEGPNDMKYEIFKVVNNA